MSEEILELMPKYVEKFGEQFPLMQVQGVPLDEVAAMMREAIASGKQPTFRDDVLY